VASRGIEKPLQLEVGGSPSTGDTAGIGLMSELCFSTSVCILSAVALVSLRSIATFG
jgi:hypothetical protein